MSKLLFRILSGKIKPQIGPKTYTVYPLSYSRKYLAELFYEETLEEFLQAGCLSKDEMKFKVLLFREKLRPDYEAELKRLNEQLDDLKIQLFEVVNENGKPENKVAEIIKNNEAVGNILEKLHHKDSITAEGMAELEKTKYLLRHGLRQKVSESVLDNIIFWLTKNFIKEKEYRTIARSGSLSNIVSAGIPFKNNPLTDEQITLLYWHRFYSNVQGHPEKPFDRVIENDWALDGWCIKQARKSKQRDAENYVESKIHSDAVRNSSEVYIPRQPGTDMTKEIYEANSEMGKAYMKAKFDLINRGRLDASSESKLAKGFGVGE